MKCRDTWNLLSNSLAKMWYIYREVYVYICRCVSHRIEKNKRMLTIGESKQRVYKCSWYYFCSFFVDLKNFPLKAEGKWGNANKMLGQC